MGKVGNKEKGKDGRSKRRTVTNIRRREAFLLIRWTQKTKLGGTQEKTDTISTEIRTTQANILTAKINPLQHCPSNCGLQALHTEVRKFLPSCCLEISPNRPQWFDLEFLVLQ
jgi:hypothetical protein